MREVLTAAQFLDEQRAKDQTGPEWFEYGAELLAGTAYTIEALGPFDCVLGTISTIDTQDNVTAEIETLFKDAATYSFTYTAATSALPAWTDIQNSVAAFRFSVGAPPLRICRVTSAARVAPHTFGTMLPRTGETFVVGRRYGRTFDRPGNLRGVELSPALTLNAASSRSINFIVPEGMTGLIEVTFADSANTSSTHTFNVYRRQGSVVAATVLVSTTMVVASTAAQFKAIESPLEAGAYRITIGAVTTNMTALRVALALTKKVA